MNRHIIAKVSEEMVDMSTTEVDRIQLGEAGVTIDRTFSFAFPLTI